jgi:Cft2 family RNA processing exonuclease
MERDRAVYDYGRRGRSRSPEDGTSCLDYLLGHESILLNVGVRKRRRSVSPYERDPRARYDEYGR